MKEIDIQSAIRLALSDKCTMFRINVGCFSTADGRYISTGVPKGFSDLFGVRKSDGKAIFIEVKTPNGRVREEQSNFLARMRECGAIAGVCRSAEDAVRLVSEDI